MDKVTADLKGADFEKKLVWRSKEGINVKPFYREDDLNDLPHMGTLPGEFPFVRGNDRLSNSWYIRQTIIVKDAVTANKKALNILNRGVTSLGFVFEPETVYTVELLGTLLDGIFIESVELNLYPQGSAIELLQSFKAFLKERGIKPGKVNGALEADPLGRYMVQGKLCIPIEDGIAYLKGVAELAADMPKFRVLQIVAANFSNAGGSVVQELAMGMSMANEYLSQLGDKDVDPAFLAKKTGFVFGIGSNYFFEIAKLRAARMLWATIVKKHGVKDLKAMEMNIHAVTSEWNKTIYDPYVNMLRTQTEAMSATLGGADSLSILSFDSVYSEGKEFGERIARNQQLLLKEEAHFDKIVDPGAGSYYIEKLTAMVAEQAWDMFIEIESMGGFLAALKSGFIQEKVAGNAAKRDANVAKGREKLLGTNIFPNALESLENILPSSPETTEETEIRPLRIYRAAELFENLRYDTDSSEHRPKVFMFTIGNPVMRKARAQFSSNFFAVAGYEIIDNIGFNTVTEGLKAAIEASADIVVICSSDDEYRTFGPEIYSGLSDKAAVVIAGAPDCEAELREGGIEHFISIKSDILLTLQGFNKLLGISR